MRGRIYPIYCRVCRASGAERKVIAWSTSRTAGTGISCSVHDRVVNTPDGPTVRALPSEEASGSFVITPDDGLYAAFADEVRACLAIRKQLREIAAEADGRLRYLDEALAAGRQTVRVTLLGGAETDIMEEIARVKADASVRRQALLDQARKRIERMRDMLQTNAEIRDRFVR